VLEGSLQQGLQGMSDVAGPVDSAIVFSHLGEIDVTNPAHEAAIPPLANLISSGTCDPHPRRATTPAAVEQIFEFLRPGGRAVNTCAGLCDGATVDEQSTIGSCDPAS